MRRIFFIFFALAALAGAVLALIGRLIARRENVDWRDAALPGKIADIDGVGIHYIDKGHGPAVVLVHGFGGHTFSFRHTISALATDHRVVAVDLMGFGYSERPANADYSLTAQATRVLRLMDALGIDSAVALGHSMGGEVVMRMAALSPERVEKLILVASVSSDRLPSLPATPLLKPFLPALARLTSHLLLRRSVYDRTFITLEMREGYLAPMRIRGSRDGLYQMLRDGRKDKKVDFSRITQPVLLLSAAAEKIVPGFALARIRSRLPQAEVVVIENAGHLLLEEQPDACNAAILNFLTPHVDAPETETEAIDGGRVPA
jgi:pimeloyl-ACP methyl ester carboxylesterase